jgi:hypothetical protein
VEYICEFKKTEIFNPVLTASPRHHLMFPGQEIHQLMPTPDEPLKMLTWPAVGVVLTKH